MLNAMFLVTRASCVKQNPSSRAYETATPKAAADDAKFKKFWILSEVLLRLRRNPIMDQYCIDTIAKSNTQSNVLSNKC